MVQLVVQWWQIVQQFLIKVNVPLSPQDPVLPGSAPEVELLSTHTRVLGVPDASFVAAKERKQPKHAPEGEHRRRQSLEMGCSGIEATWTPVRGCG